MADVMKELMIMPSLFCSFSLAQGPTMLSSAIAAENAVVAHVSFLCAFSPMNDSFAFFGWSSIGRHMHAAR